MPRLPEILHVIRKAPKEGGFVGSRKREGALTRPEFWQSWQLCQTAIVPVFESGETIPVEPLAKALVDAVSLGLGFKPRRCERHLKSAAGGGRKPRHLFVS